MIFIGFGLNLVFHRPDWTEAFTPFLPNGWGGVFKAMGLTFIAFQGFEVISQCSEEIKNPKKEYSPRSFSFSYHCRTNLPANCCYIIRGSKTNGRFNSLGLFSLAQRDSFS